MEKTAVIPASPEVVHLHALYQHFLDCVRGRAVRSAQAEAKEGAQLAAGCPRACGCIGIRVVVDVGHGDICQCHCHRMSVDQRALTVVALDVVHAHPDESEEFCRVEDWGTST